MITGYWLSQPIYCAAKLGLADLLKDSSKSATELASLTGVHAQSLYRVLRLLASIGVFAETETGQFELTPLAQCLQTDHPESMRAYAIMMGEEWQWQPWGKLLHSVRTGKPAFDSMFGVDCFQYFARNAEAAAIFDEAMTGFSAIEVNAVTAAYDFSPFTKVIDIGGGQGRLIATILMAHPHTQGILFDMPHVIAEARSHIEATGIADRCELLAGDFFEAVPAGGDAYVLKRVIHDWDDERTIAMLKNCHRAMLPKGRLVIIEMVIAPGNEPFFGKQLDVELLLTTPGGRERTEAEYRSLLSAAGFELTTITPTESLVSVIEGVRV
jgi:O-methyltransferase domain/Dimerisation domain